MRKDDQNDDNDDDGAADDGNPTVHGEENLHSRCFFMCVCWIKRVHVCAWVTPYKHTHNSLSTPIHIGGLEYFQKKNFVSHEGRTIPIGMSMFLGCGYILHSVIHSKMFLRVPPFFTEGQGAQSVLLLSYSLCWGFYFTLQSKDRCRWWNLHSLTHTYTFTPKQTSRTHIQYTSNRRAPLIDIAAVAH